MSEYRAFWDCPAQDAPAKSGAWQVMDCSDIQDVLDNIGLTLIDKHVLDVGCGTGRLAQLCGHHRGFDIAPGMVKHATAAGRDATLIAGPQDLTGATGDIVCCLSVFTHIDHADAGAYLEAFTACAPLLLVDILPGTLNGGSIATTYTVVEDFRVQLHAYGWQTKAEYERFSPDGEPHRYYLCHLKEGALTWD